MTAAKPTPNAMLTAALAYRELGWSVIPIRDDGSKIPQVSWKKYQTERADAAQIRRWWNKWPTSNVGIVTGEISGVVVMDFDSQDAMMKYEATVGEIPMSISQTTGRQGKGLHVFLQHPGFRVKQAHSRILNELDIKGDGSIALLPPSKHKTGKRYKWTDIDPTEMGLDDLLPIPDELIKAMNSVDAPKPGSQTRNVEGWVQELLLNGSVAGQRNEDTARLTGYYCNMYDGDFDRVMDRLTVWNIKANQEPLDDAELVKTVKSVHAKYIADKDADKERESSAVYSQQRVATPINSLLTFKITLNDTLHYPDGKTFYRLGFETPDPLNPDPDAAPLDRSVTVGVETLVSLPKMSVTLLPLLLVSLSARLKARDWADIVDRLVNNSTHVVVGLEESDLAQVYEIISGEVSQREAVGKSVEHLEGAPAVIIGNAEIVTTVRAIERALDTVGQMAPSRRELGEKLARIGFIKQKNRPHINKQRTTTWAISIGKFEEWMNQ